MKLFGLVEHCSHARSCGGTNSELVKINQSDLPETCDWRSVIRRKALSFSAPHYEK
jgi:hypothetical protein